MVTACASRCKGPDRRQRCIEIAGRFSLPRLAVALEARIAHDEVDQPLCGLDG
jgi:hypothetical protein